MAATTSSPALLSLHNSLSQQQQRTNFPSFSSLFAEHSTKFQSLAFSCFSKQVDIGVSKAELQHLFLAPLSSVEVGAITNEVQGARFILQATFAKETKCKLNLFGETTSCTTYSKHCSYSLHFISASFFIKSNFSSASSSSSDSLRIHCEKVAANFISSVSSEPSKILPCTILSDTICFSERPLEIVQEAETHKIQEFVFSRFRDYNLLRLALFESPKKLTEKMLVKCSAKSLKFSKSRNTLICKDANIKFLEFYKAPITLINKTKRYRAKAAQQNQQLLTFTYSLIGDDNETMDISLRENAITVVEKRGNHKDSKTWSTLPYALQRLYSTLTTIGAVDLKPHQEVQQARDRVQQVTELMTVTPTFVRMAKISEIEIPHFFIYTKSFEHSLGVSLRKLCLDYTHLFSKLLNTSMSIQQAYYGSAFLVIAAMSLKIQNSFGQEEQLPIVGRLPNIVLQEPDQSYEHWPCLKGSFSSLEVRGATSNFGALLQYMKWLKLKRSSESNFSKLEYLRRVKWCGYDSTFDLQKLTILLDFDAVYKPSHLSGQSSSSSLVPPSAADDQLPCLQIRIDLQRQECEVVFKRDDSEVEDCILYDIIPNSSDVVLMEQLKKSQQCNQFTDVAFIL